MPRLAIDVVIRVGINEMLVIVEQGAGHQDAATLLLKLDELRKSPTRRPTLRNHFDNDAFEFSPLGRLNDGNMEIVVRGFPDPAVHRFASVGMRFQGSCG